MCALAFWFRRFGVKACLSDVPKYARLFVLMEIFPRVPKLCCDPQGRAAKKELSETTASIFAQLWRAKYVIMARPWLLKHSESPSLGIGFDIAIFRFLPSCKFTRRKAADPAVFFCEIANDIIRVLFPLLHCAPYSSGAL